MGVDWAFMDQHSTLVSDGIEERVFLMEVGEGRCFALLSRPAEAKDLGFVVCHSYGLELLTLRRTERAVARTLASLGYPVLAFHRRGYGDSSGSLEDATLEWQLQDVRAAADFLASETGASRLGLVGARFGALIGASAAREGGVERLLLMNPPLKGTDYFRQAIKDMHMVQVANRDGGPRRSIEEMLEGLQRDGVMDVLGHPIYRHLYDALAGVDLTSDIGAFTGDTLALHISKSSKIPRGLESFGDLVRARGGRCSIELVREPPGTKFGGAAFVSTTDPIVRVDVQEPVVQEVTRLTAEWISR